MTSFMVFLLVKLLLLCELHRVSGQNSTVILSFRIRRFSEKASSGRVEVYINGLWSAVSYKGWTIEAGNVVCRMLGFPNATSIFESSIMGRLGLEWVQVKHCFGNESSLYDCSLNILEYPVLTQYNGEAGVICGQPNGIAMIGEVVLGIEGIPAGIGSTFWNDSAAKVVCRMLNMAGPYVAPRIDSSSHVSTPIWMDKVKCSGNERTLLDCNHPGLTNKRLTVSASSKRAVVGCGKQEISLKITGGRNEQEGNVEAYMNGVMVFLVLNNDNEQNVAKVICRTLGLPPPIMIVRNTKTLYLQSYGGLKGFIAVFLLCTGNERHISECNTSITAVFPSVTDLHGVSCRKDYQCPTGCRCDLVYLYGMEYKVWCVNSNLTETIHPLPGLTRVL
ncbi:scavenger receptor cysteine-rich type 1 protein M160-like [Actinia tenebrosa]|uniref:Scavenger receptor cysteine-rich type 1 protein M160-like n=1 Tax=Actinia tenebrosa TaxID=6105 RepID=A0A6P8I790_ACTTE|nr:scavenger receptor cysteine-rich type 1 protein M160-like [Actinia tenebrosa]